MLKKLSFSLIKSAWLLALLIMTSVLPAHAQSEFYDQFYKDSDYQEWLFKFDYSEDLNGYIVIPNKSGVGGNRDWEHQNQLYVPSIYLGDGKPVVGLSGFGSLKNLAEIIFPEDCHVKYICDNCFQYCTSLGTSEELNLPESVETIGHYAFYGCSGLKVANLSSNLKSIGVGAFKYCYQLQSITLPKSLKEIREWAFQDCN
ncbi:MAG: leucine-rich repeat domain-containing protein [Muribaculaceae bacterium]